MRDETTLRECPFCWGEAETVGDDILGWKVECMKCGAGTRTCCTTEAEAIAAWNTRAERTCRMAFGDDMLPECGNCGEPLVYYTRRHGFNAGDKRSACYCPSCGAKVVDA